MVVNDIEDEEEEDKQKDHHFHLIQLNDLMILYHHHI
jgi:hypothetical protein